MTRPARARIDLAALRHNFAVLAGRAGDSQCYGVIKADGYGHGIGQVARALETAPKFAVAYLQEALRIREAGIDKPVLLLEGVFGAAELPICAAQGFEVMLHAWAQIEDLAQAGRGDLPPLAVWLKLNTGMNRLGFAPEQALEAVARLRTLPNVRVLGAMTHFACADDPDLTHAQRQLDCLLRWRELAGPGLSYAAANSAALIALPDARLDWVRPGIMLYGSSPFPHISADELGLRPVMHLQSALLATRDLKAGDTVGYGAAWRATGPSRMGVVAIGYADGYPRHAPQGTPVWVAGQRVPLIGRVSMDMITVDLSQCPQAQVGDPVELWGGRVSVDEVADRAGTISYELLTGVTQRVPRQYAD